MSDEKRSFTGSLLRGLTRNTVEALAMKMGLKPSDRGWVAVDIGASLVSSSPKVAMDFFKAVQEVSTLLDNGDLRAWAELGKRVATNSHDEAKDAAFLRRLYSPADRAPSAQCAWLIDRVCANVADIHWARLQESPPLGAASFRPAAAAAGNPLPVLPDRPGRRDGPHIAGGIHD